MAVGRGLSEDRQRLAGWVREHGAPVRGYLFAQLGDSELAADLAQEVFTRAWEARDRYEERGKARAYLLTIADRLAVQHRRRRREVTLDDAILGQLQTSTPACRLEYQETSIQLQRALATLSEPQRRTLLMRYFGEMPFEQIADALGLPLNTVLSHCRRGLAALKNSMVTR